MDETKADKNVHLIYGVALVAVVSIFSFLLYKADRPGMIKLKLGENVLEMQMEGDSVSIKGMLDHLFKDEITRRESGALLREFGSFYQPDDPALIEEFEQQDIESDISKKLRDLLYGLKGPFSRSAHTYYNVEDVQMVDAIQKLGFDHPVSKELRELLVYRKGPFEEHAKKILLSVPAGNAIPVGRGASCKGNEFYRREIRIFNFQRTKSISVYVSGSFPCAEDEQEGDMGRLVQLSNKDVKNLIGDSPLDAKEAAFAEILIDAQ